MVYWNPLYASPEYEELLYLLKNRENGQDSPEIDLFSLDVFSLGMAFIQLQLAKFKINFSSDLRRQIIQQSQKFETLRLIIPDSHQSQIDLSKLENYYLIQ